MKNILLCTIAVICAFNGYTQNSKKLAITIENNIAGAPITMGIPFPKGELNSVLHMRLLNHDGNEIPLQTTEVITWQPIDGSVKWVWVFFFSDQYSDYTLEYGQDVSPTRFPEHIISTNDMRTNGGITVNTGPLKFTINKFGNGFLDQVYIDDNNDKSFTENELIATSAPDENRGTFLDVLDDAGLDMSNAVINQVFREEGSGRLHTIFRIDGTYYYENGNNPSPFEIRIHAYAGKSYIKVLHTLTYTGIPDKHTIQKGEHLLIATQNDTILSEETSDDPGWTQPNDQIAGSGLTIKYHLDDDELEFITSTYDGDWYKETPSVEFNVNQITNKKIGVLQTGPKHNEFKNSTSTKRIQGFDSRIYKGDKTLKHTQKAKGWIDISDSSRGISLGIKNFFKEYPKELQINPISKTLIGYIWPSDIKPMSFARKNTEEYGNMLANFAQGLTKTTDLIYYFHGESDVKKINEIMNYLLKAPVAHASPLWYTQSKVYGNMAPYSSKYPEYENALQYKYDWIAFNRKWEPWYGMFNYGDSKNYYVKGEWIEWNNNEPMVDFQFWTNFIRTGDAKYYYLAESKSEHTMDVDNIHWPKKREYIGDSNDAISFWDYKDEPESTPYLGIGRRHSKDHWYSALSAHVWVKGWLACYYLTGNQRALDVAKMTGDTYLKRIWGKHDLRGRRLYLSVVNLVELYDATKNRRYKSELDERVNIMLRLQKGQGGNLVLDRYGYSQTYVAQGLYKYYKLTGDIRVKNALIDHARWVLNVPPLNHKMESYLATIYPLVLGYEFTGNDIYLDEAINRAEFLKVSKLPKINKKLISQKEYSDVLLEVSNLPKNKSAGFTNWELNQGLRVFGWTTAFNIPYLLYWLE